MHPRGGRPSAVFGGLDDSNAALARDYANGYEVSEGIDPAWDAGVIELDQLAPGRGFPGPNFPRPEAAPPRRQGE